MPPGATIALFAVAAVALLVVPGPSVLYLVTQSIAMGRRGGMAAMIGIQTAGAVHVILAAAGLSAIVVSSAAAFGLIKYAGAAYLIWMGVRRLMRRESIVDTDASTARTPSARVAFRQGFLVNLLNPKSAIFFVAVLPQFVDRSLGRTWLQVMTLGAVFLCIAVVSDGVWVLSAGWMASRLRTRRAQTIERTLSAGVLFALGVAAAIQRRP